MPLGWILGGAGVISSIIGGSAATSAADTQAAAANQAAQVAQNQFNTTQTNLAPNIGAGQNALSVLLAELGITPAGSTAATPTASATAQPNLGGYYGSPQTTGTPTGTGTPGGVPPTTTGVNNGAVSGATAPPPPGGYAPGSVNPQTGSYYPTNALAGATGAATGAPTTPVNPSTATPVIGTATGNGGVTATGAATSPTLPAGWTIGANGQLTGPNGQTPTALGMTGQAPTTGAAPAPVIGTATTGTVSGVPINSLAPATGSSASSPQTVSFQGTTFYVDPTTGALSLTPPAAAAAATPASTSASFNPNAPLVNQTPGFVLPPAFNPAQSSISLPSYNTPSPLAAPATLATPAAFSYDPSQVANDPAYKFSLQQGQQAIANQTAASGGGLGGNTLEALTKFAQGNASTYENQDYTQALGTYTTNAQTPITYATTNANLANQNYLTNAQTQLAGYNANNAAQLSQFGANLGASSSIYDTNFSDLLNAFTTNASLTQSQQQQLYNMLSGVVTSGQNAATNVGTQGASVAGTVGSDIVGAANASAAGTVGAANAATGGLNSLSNAYLLSQLIGGSSGSGSSSAGSGAFTDI